VSSKISFDYIKVISKNKLISDENHPNFILKKQKNCNIDKSNKVWRKQIDLVLEIETAQKRVFSHLYGQKPGKMAIFGQSQQIACTMSIFSHFYANYGYVDQVEKLSPKLEPLTIAEK